MGTDSCMGGHRLCRSCSSSSVMQRELLGLIWQVQSWVPAAPRVGLGVQICRCPVWGETVSFPLHSTCRAKYPQPQMQWEMQGKTVNMLGYRNPRAPCNPEFLSALTHSPLDCQYQNGDPVTRTTYDTI